MALTNNNIIISTPTRKATFTRNSRLASNLFVRNLFELLESKKYENLVRWTDEGETFVVIDAGRFTSDILPSKFNHSNFASFVRQLNKFGFHKIKKTYEERMMCIYGELSWEFVHPLFRMHDREAMEKITKKPPNQNGRNMVTRIDAKQPDNLIDTLKLTSLKNTQKGAIVINSNLIDAKVNSITQNLNSLEKKIESQDDKNQLLFSEFHSLKTELQNLLNAFMEYKQTNNIILEKLNIAYDSLRNKSEGSSNKLLLKNDTVMASSNVKSQDLLAGERFEQDTFDGRMFMQKPYDNPVTSMNNDQKNNPVIQLNFNSRSKDFNSNSKISKPGINESKNIKIDDMTRSISDRGFQILLFENDPKTISLCQMLFKKYRINLDIKSNWQIIEQNIKENKYDLYLFNPSIYTNGVDIISKLKKEFSSNLPIVLLVNELDDNKLLFYMEQGISNIINKPIKEKELMQLLLNNLRGKIPAIIANNISKQKSPIQEKKDSPSFKIYGIRGQSFFRVQSNQEKSDQQQLNSISNKNNIQRPTLFSQHMAVPINPNNRQFQPSNIQLDESRLESVPEAISNIRSTNLDYQNTSKMLYPLKTVPGIHNINELDEDSNSMLPESANLEEKNTFLFFSSINEKSKPISPTEEIISGMRSNFAPNGAMHFTLSNTDCNYLSDGKVPQNENANSNNSKPNTITNIKPPLTNEIMFENYRGSCTESQLDNKDK